jgi:hypothetical protein
MSDIKTWDTTAAGNDSTPPDGAPEGMNRTDVNNVIRENMAATKRWYDAPEFVNPVDADTVQKGSATTVEIVGVDRTALYPVDARVKIVGASTVYGFVNSSVFGADTVVTVDVDDAADVPDTITAFEVAGARSLSRAAYGAGLDIIEIQTFLF